MNMQMKKGTLFASLAVILAACATPSSSAGSSTSQAPTFVQANNVVIYTRDTTSGTRDGFMGGIGFSAAAKNDNLLTSGFLIADNTAILTAMSGSDKYGIGYVSLSSVNNNVKGLLFNNIEATEATVLDNSYGLKRPFNWMLRADGDFPSDEVEDIAKAFVAFMGTIQGGETITGAGAVALDSTTNWDSISSNYPICAQNNAAVTVRLGGSDSIEKVAKALTTSFKARCGNFVAEHDHSGSGDAYKRTNDPLIKDTSVGKDIGFASRGFTSAEQLVGGVALPSNQLGQLAWDAIVAIVHKDNPLVNVNADLLKRMYEKASTSPIRTWAEALTAEAAI